MDEKGRRENEPTRKNLASEVESLSIHGISRVYSSRPLSLKLIWLALSISAFAFLISFAAISVNRYLKREVYTKVERVGKKSIKFPAVTFCSTNSLSNEASSYDHFSFPENQELPENCSFTNETYFKNKINRQFFMQACHWFFGHKSFSEMQSIARVGKYHVELIKFPKHFSFQANMWPCFTLNPNKKLTQYGAGAESGIRMILQFDEEDSSTKKYLDVLDDDGHGLFLTIHDPQEHMIGHNSISLPLGFHTSIEISKNVFKRKPDPFPSKCVQAWGQKTENIFPGKERINSCRLSCFYKLVHRRCGGVIPATRTFMKPEKYPGFVNVSDRKSVFCIHETIKYMEECECRVPCEEETYKSKVSRVPWPQGGKAAQLNELLFQKEDQNRNQSKDLKKKLMKLSIYYTDMCEFVYTEEEKYDVMSILSDFGGQMGLFIGASVLSFIEVIILVASCVLSYFSKSRIVHP